MAILTTVAAGAYRLVNSCEKSSLYFLNTFGFQFSGCNSLATGHGFDYQWIKASTERKKLVFASCTIKFQCANDRPLYCGASTVGGKIYEYPDTEYRFAEQPFQGVSIEFSPDRSTAIVCGQAICEIPKMPIEVDARVYECARVDNDKNRNDKNRNAKGR